MRIFGPLYMPGCVISLLLNLLFRVVTGKFENLGREAYYRICFEDWAYAGGSTSEENINWGGWILWFLLSPAYAVALLLVFVGMALKSLLLAAISASALILYTLIRTFVPAGK